MGDLKVHLTLILYRILVMIQIVLVQFCFVKTKIFLSFLLQKFLYNSLCYKKETVFSSQFYVHLWFMQIALKVDFLFWQSFFYNQKSRPSLKYEFDFPAS